MPSADPRAFIVVVVVFERGCSSDRRRRGQQRRRASHLRVLCVWMRSLRKARGQNCIRAFERNICVKNIFFFASIRPFSSATTSTEKQVIRGES